MNINPRILGKGRVLHTSADGWLYFSRGYSVFRTPVSTPMSHVESLGALPSSPIRRASGMFRTAGRLMRFEVKALRQVGEKTLLASIREGLFWNHWGQWLPSAIETPAGRPLRAPMRLNARENGPIIWGEYGRNMDREPVSIFVSEDQGKSFHPIYSFNKGDIRHIHHVIPCNADEGYWVLTGDYDEEPGIAHLSPCYSRLEWVGRGQQIFRAVHLFEEGQNLVYGTDTELEENAVIRCHSKTGQIERLQGLSGSCLYGTRCGEFKVISTTVEPSQVNGGNLAEVWVTHDHKEWTRVMSGEKDRLPGLPFQFGSWVLPTGETDVPHLFMSGQSLRGFDERILMLPLRDPQN